MIKIKTSLRATLFLFLMSVFYVNSFSQKWPFIPQDDPKDWNKISCTFGEIHETNKDHFHCGIDIDVNRGHCPVRAVMKGRVFEITNTTLTLEHEFPEGSGNYCRRTKYIHVANHEGKSGKKNKQAKKTSKNKKSKKSKKSSKGFSGLKVKQGELVEEGQIITEVASNKSGWSGHLHLEFYQYENGVWYAVNPLRNDLKWNVELPKDDYGSEINDVFLKPILNENVVSGFNLSLTKAGISKSKEGTLKIHFNDRPGSHSKKYNPKYDKPVVFGNLASIMSARDKGINFIESSGDGMTVYRAGYSIQDELKYEIAFDRIEQDKVYDINCIFHTSFNTKKDKYNGNNDYLNLYNECSYYLYPQKKINNIPSNGIWYSKAASSEPNISSEAPTVNAFLNMEALYPDGYYTLSYFCEDVSGKKDNVDLYVVLDNFLPFVQQVEIIDLDKDEYCVYFEKWVLNKDKTELNNQNSKNETLDPVNSKYLLKVRTSESMSELSFEVPGISKPVKLNKDETGLFWSISLDELKKAKLKSNSMAFLFKGYDLAGNELVSFKSDKVLIKEVPYRTSNDEWYIESVQNNDSRHIIKLSNK